MSFVKNPIYEFFFFQIAPQINAKDMINGVYNNQQNFMLIPYLLADLNFDVWFSVKKNFLQKSEKNLSFVNLS